MYRYLIFKRFIAVAMPCVCNGMRDKTNPREGGGGSAKSNPGSACQAVIYTFNAHMRSLYFRVFYQNPTDILDRFN